uniref:Uncharacterized protein n=1 Tax=Setaria italica TaxID=4555 RepID=K3YNZ9_SETIT
MEVIAMHPPILAASRPFASLMETTKEPPVFN